VGVDASVSGHALSFQVSSQTHSDAVDLGDLTVVGPHEGPDVSDPAFAVVSLEGGIQSDVHLGGRALWFFLTWALGFLFGLGFHKHGVPVDGCLAEGGHCFAKQAS
jgi:hypothetical protein